MAPEDRERMKELCQKIQEEHDSQAFMALVQELSDLLDGKHRPETVPGKAS
jgi:hypothetical protein